MRAPKSLKLGEAPAIKAMGLDAIGRGDREFDLTDLTQADSSAVAVLLAWQRAAHAAGGAPIRFTGAQPSLLALARLYGVAPLIFSEATHHA